MVTKEQNRINVKRWLDKPGNREKKKASPAARKAALATREKNKAFAAEVGLSAYKVALYGIQFLKDNPDVLASVQAIHQLSGYRNVDPEIKAVRSEIAADTMISNNKEKNRLYSKKYYEKNKEIIKEKLKLKPNEDEMKRYKKEYYQKNREVIIARAIKHREENRETINEKQRIKRQENKLTKTK